MDYHSLKKVVRGILDKMRHRNLKLTDSPTVDISMDEGFMRLYEKCRPYTATSLERMYALYKASQYIVRYKIPGHVVECGVWKGGSSMLCALALKQMGEVGRKIYLYDTYSGMSEPTERDLDFKGTSAHELLERKENRDVACFSSLEETRNNLSLTGYPAENFIFVEGRVEDTIPRVLPENIAILRLDTDWYESTYHELLHLFPRLSRNGVIILDDYGYWKGARAATDRYFRENQIKILLNRIDYTGRIGIRSD
jgi:predicted O-methyltransferase YrrM